MEAFFTLLVLLWGESTGHRFLSQRPVTGNFDLFFDLHQTDGWTHNRDAVDLRRHRAHYEVQYYD